MKTESDMRTFVLPLLILPLLFTTVVRSGPVHLAEGSLVPWVYAAVAVLFYLPLGRWLFPVDHGDGVSELRLPFFWGFLAAPVFVWLFHESGHAWLQRNFPPIVADFLFSGPSSEFCLTVVKQVLVVGLIEEGSKRIASGMTYQQTLSGRIGSGFAAGVGFGVAEALIYSFRDYNGHADVTTYAIRFVTGPAVHGIWSAMSTFIRCHLPELETLWAGFACLIPSAIIHGTSNALLHHRNIGGAAMLVFWTTFAFAFVYCVRRRMQELEDELDTWDTVWRPNWDRR